LTIQSQLAWGALDKHESQVARSAVDKHDSSNSNLLLRLNGAELGFHGLIARQPVHSALACSFLRRAPAVAWTHSTSTVNCEAAQSVKAELEGLAVTIKVRHGLQESFFESPGARCWVAADGSAADLELSPELQSRQSSWLFGPALILALARRGVYCLHASSFDHEVDQQVYHQGQASVIVGDSGAGKSSFARELQESGHVRRLTDDISPITLDHGSLVLLPFFPQLKLAQSPPDLPEQVPLTGLIALRAAVCDQAASCEALDAPAIYFKLLRHTVASRLFSTRDAAAWWDFMHQAQLALTRSDAPKCQLRARFAPKDLQAAMLEAFSLTQATR
jgi:hypothetical protein